MEMPDLLTHEYVENMLKKYFKYNTVKVINIETKPASAKGESFCSIMTRMKVNYKVGSEKNLKHIHCIAKTCSENPNVNKFLRQYDIYNTEMEMYEKFYPQFQKMLYDIGDKDQLCAKTLYVDYERDAIVFEDLTVRNFSTANRLTGLDECHMKLCLRKLAKMHAAAAVVNEHLSGILEKYTRGILNRHVGVFGNFITNILKVGAKFASSCPELGSYYGDKLAKLVPLSFEYALRCHDPKPEHFLTLNHGDMWTNNVMFQYNEKNGRKVVKDVLLLDFQYSCWTSPALDLYYFFYTSGQDDIILNHQPALIQYYHGVLADTLEKLKYNQHIPTLHELNIQLLERGFLAVTGCLVNLAIVANDKTEDFDLETIVGSDEKSQRLHNGMYANERVQRLVKEMLPRFDKLGLLEILK